MPVLRNADASFSSKQELLDMQDCSLSRGPSLHNFSPLDSQTGSPVSSGPTSPGITGTGGPAQPHIFTEASTRPGHRCNTETSPNAGAPTGPKPISSDSDQICGWGPVTSKALQVFNTPHWVLFFLCVASFLQGIVINGFTSTVVTSIERRFDLQSYQTGLIISSFDIAACICLAFVSYFGGTGHKPHWLGRGLLIMALGSLVFALPHFTTPSYQVSMPEETGICSANRTSVCQGEQGGGLSSYRFVFMLGQFLNGMGSTPLYTLGVTYLDENVRPDYAPVYIGIFHTASIVGPAVGYLLGGYFLTIFTEIHLMTDMTPQDPLWVGAWWIGFLAGAPAFLLIAFLILGYPRQLRGSQEFAAMRVSEAHQLKDGSHTTASDPQFGKSVKDMPRSVLLLLKNPTFIFLCLAGATEATLVSSMTTFGPKFLESQFSLSASQAATIFGFMVVPAGGGGTFLGGYIVKRLSLRCQGIIRFCIACATVSLLSILIFLIQCPNVPMAGVTLPYQSGLTEGHELDQYKLLNHIHSSLRLTNSSSVEGNLTAGCNAGCNCVRELYNPVCGTDGIMYYSPCHAGCTAINHTEGKVVYSGCSCVGGNVSWGEEGVVLTGKCSNSCQHMPLILSFFFITIIFTFLCSIPALTATLRCVPHSQRSFALGIQWILVRALGTVPGPIAFGALIDNSCLLWQDRCGEQGSCYLYQNSTMSLYIMAAGIIYKVLGFTFFSLASISYRPPPKSPQSSCESTDHGGGGGSDLPDKNLAEDGIIVNRHARL